MFVFGGVILSNLNSSPFTCWQDPKHPKHAYYRHDFADDLRTLGLNFSFLANPSNLPLPLLLWKLTYWKTAKTGRPIPFLLEKTFIFFWGEIHSCCFFVWGGGGGEPVTWKQKHPQKKHPTSSNLQLIALPQLCHIIIVPDLQKTAGNARVPEMDRLRRLMGRLRRLMDGLISHGFFSTGIFCWTSVKQRVLWHSIMYIRILVLAFFDPHITEWYIIP